MAILDSIEQLYLNGTARCFCSLYPRHRDQLTPTKTPRNDGLKKDFEHSGVREVFTIVLITFAQIL